ncbi:AraC family transcriptional regulator [Chitinophaga pinensis]|uniref:Transcriptional regulator, AraC family n=1 Tax=Chitinophaga pinensis (strain ATCC 43595 / DSM 2588 / LMG 13176 / NBRC 15968 / NCIMB 11800 / UQM 2034) TaxID=485918 RepID=A0A979G2X8_CHIPD|nr:AraC family transcriptional regulator [Chitinophaga pinensis]ACU59762.1 transcriptional regulator, AraC family [Chitinophaga pinensis DSM 2588]
MPSLIDILLPEEVKTSRVIPQEFQAHVYPFTKPIFRSTSAFTRIEQIIAIRGCRIMNVTTMVDEDTVMRVRRKNDVLTLHIMLQGTVTWSVPMEGRISLAPGEYRLLKMNTGLHEMLLPAGLSEFIQIDIPPSLIADILPASTLVRSLLTSALSFQCSVSPRPMEQKFRYLIDDIRQTVVKDGIQQLRLYAQLTELITAAIDSLEETGIPPSGNDIHERLIFDIKVYINRHLNKKITLSEIAGAFFISASKLKKDFKKSEQQTVLAYLQEQRMQRAMQLLQASDNKLSHIAQEVGYSNLSSFTREFRKHFDCSPKVVRLNIRNRHI